MRLPSKSSTFWILIAASAVSAFLLPREWTTPGRGLFQPLALLQWPATWLSGKVDTATSEGVSEALTPEQVRELVEERPRLQRQVLQQRLALQEAERRIDELTGLTGQMPDSHVGVIVAPIVAFDADPRRETLLIAKSQQKRWVHEGDWVVAVSGDAPEWDGDATFRDLVQRGWLVGRVMEVHPRVARVLLATDPSFQVEVKPARMLADGTLQLASESCVLSGQGGSRMRISLAFEDYFRTGYRVAVVESSRELPVSLTIGRIEDSKSLDDSAQHFDLRVVPWAPAEKLTHVYVLTTAP